jgi:hypothetical protein
MIYYLYIPSSLISHEPEDLGKIGNFEEEKSKRGFLRRSFRRMMSNLINQKAIEAPGAKKPCKGFVDFL